MTDYQAPAVPDDVWQQIVEARRLRHHRKGLANGKVRRKTITKAEHVRLHKAADKAYDDTIVALGYPSGQKFYAGRLEATCGTRGGAARHYDHGEKPCQDCRLAARRATKAYEADLAKHKLRAAESKARTEAILRTRKLKQTLKERSVI